MIGGCCCFVSTARRIIRNRSFTKPAPRRQVELEKSGEEVPDHLVALAEEAVREWDMAQKQRRVQASASEAAARVEHVLSVEIQRTLTGLERYLSLLATIGATAPFIGLFGTVWGIMNSFQSIAVTRETSLAVVAPGIAEALFATAFGLFVAIPAVIFYNWLSGEVARYAARLDIFAKEFLVISGWRHPHRPATCAQRAAFAWIIRCQNRAGAIARSMRSMSRLC